jgi:hypothetical protein
MVDMVDNEPGEIGAAKVEVPSFITGAFAMLASTTNG